MLGPRPGACSGWGLLWCYRHVWSPGSEPLTQSCGILAPTAACRRAATSESARAQRDELSLLPCLRSAGKMLQRLSGEKANYAGWLCFEKLVMCKQRRKTRVSARCQAGSGPATQGKALLHASAWRRAGELALRGSCGGTALPPALPAACSMGKKKTFTPRPHPCLPCCPVPWQYGTFLLSSLQLSAAPGKASWPLLWPLQSRCAPDPGPGGCQWWAQSCFLPPSLYPLCPTPLSAGCLSPGTPLPGPRGPELRVGCVHWQPHLALPLPAEPSPSWWELCTLQPGSLSLVVASC